jgi:hypothetical protein
MAAGGGGKGVGAPGSGAGTGGGPLGVGAHGTLIHLAATNPILETILGRKVASGGGSEGAEPLEINVGEFDSAWGGGLGGCVGARGAGAGRGFGGARRGVAGAQAWTTASWCPRARCTCCTWA